MATIEAPTRTVAPSAPETEKAPQRVVVGKRMPKIEGVEKVTGKAKYGADVSRQGMLWGKLLGSPHAHAKIKRIDTGKARSIPGVFAVLTGEDLPRLVAEISNTTPAPE